MWPGGCQCRIQNNILSTLLFVFILNSWTLYWCQLAFWLQSREAQANIFPRDLGVALPQRQVFSHFLYTHLSKKTKTFEMCGFVCFMPVAQHIRCTRLSLLMWDVLRIKGICGGKSNKWGGGKELKMSGGGIRNELESSAAIQETKWRILCLKWFDFKGEMAVKVTIGVCVRRAASSLQHLPPHFGCECASFWMRILEQVVTLSAALFIHSQPKQMNCP